jgi:insertion element IS1 protein InsB
LIYFIQIIGGAYKKYLLATKHIIGKNNTQAIERLHLTFRTRIKRLCRKTICFSKLNQLHDTVIGLFINVTEFGNSINSLSTFWNHYQVKCKIYIIAPSINRQTFVTNT